MASNLDLFLKLDGIPGESIKTNHTNEVDILTWQFTAQQPVGSGSMGAATGRVRMSDITITKPVDAASPAIFQYCATGTPIKTAVITGQKATGEQTVFYVVTLTDVTVSAVTNNSVSAEGELDTIHESVTLNTGAMKMEYWPILNGIKGAVKTGKFDFGKSKV
jgi:type VI secretion system secreted protein Hcp